MANETGLTEMNKLPKQVLLFSAFSFIVSCAIVWFFWGLFTGSSSGGKLVWSSMPLIAAIASGVFLHIVARRLNPPQVNSWGGAIAALLALIFCAIVAEIPAVGNGFIVVASTLVLSSLLWVGWLAVIVGALAGFICGKAFDANSQQA